MTLIVWRSPVLAADTASFRDSFICQTNARKIIRTSTGHLVGCCGMQAYGDRFKSWALAGFPEHDKPPPLEGKDDEFGAIVVRPDGAVLEYGGDMLTTDVTQEPFVVMGASPKFAAALGTLGWSAVDIVRHCIKHLVWCAGDVYSLTLDGRAQLIDGETAEPKVVTQEDADIDVDVDAPAFEGYSPAARRMQDAAEDRQFLDDRGLG